jgi:FMN phosphatase YigB (HAD superfamily)
MNTILFDLDGTLLPIDHKQFEKIYFHGLSSRFTDLYTPEAFIKLIWDATKAMVMDTSDATNEEAFMSALGSVVDEKLEEMKRRFAQFYETDFDLVRSAVIESAEMIEAVQILKSKGYTLVVATNPMFPKIAIDKRITWTGLKREDFTYVTSFENNHFCKPQPKFYQEILSDLNLKPQDCLMVGNDVDEDMIAGALGMKTYLITNHKIHRSQKPMPIDYEGNYADFLLFVQSLPTLT